MKNLWLKLPQGLRDEAASVLKGAGVAAAGAGLTYLFHWATATDFGQWTPVVVALASVAANALRKAGLQFATAPEQE